MDIDEKKLQRALESELRKRGVDRIDVTGSSESDIAKQIEMQLKAAGVQPNRSEVRKLAKEAAAKQR